MTIIGMDWLTIAQQSVATLIATGVIAIITIVVLWFKNFFQIPNIVKQLDVNIENIKKSFKKLLKRLEKKDIISEDDVTDITALETLSPKRITSEGRKILEKHGIDTFLSVNCKDFINQDYSNKTEVDTYTDCVEYVKNNQSKKAIALTYDNDISERESILLLALAIKDKIMEKQKSSA